MRLPVWPICSWCGRQPRLVTTRETPSAPSSSSASSITPSNPSAPPAPRPAPTTTRAEVSAPGLVRARGLGGDDPGQQVGRGHLGGVLAHDGRARRRGRGGLDGVPGDGEQGGLLGEPHLLQHGAALHLPDDDERVGRADPHHVGGHRDVEPGTQVREHLHAPRGAGREHGDGVAPHGVSRPRPTPHRRRPRTRRRRRGAPRRRRTRRARRRPSRAARRRRARAPAAPVRSASERANVTVSSDTSVAPSAAVSTNTRIIGPPPGAAAGRPPRPRRRGPRRARRPCWAGRAAT